MRARALGRRPTARALPRSLSGPPHSLVGPLSSRALASLSGRDADVRLRALAAMRGAARPLLGELVDVLLARRVHETLGYRSLGDYGRERVGVGARTLREWSRVWRGLGELPLLRQAVLTGELSWGAARLVVAHVSPETEQACLESVRGRTLRAVQAIVEAVREAGDTGSPAEPDEAEEQALVRLPVSRREAELWPAAVELARRVAGEQLPLWQCAERMAAEAASSLGRGPEAEAAAPALRAQQPEVPANEHGLREQAFPAIGWAAPSAALPSKMARLGEGLADCSPRELDRRLRAVIAFLQTVDLEVGRILRRVANRGLFAELGFASLSHYAQERLDVSGRTARRLLALARSEHRAPGVAVAFRRGEIHALQAQQLARVANPESARAWVERARQVTLRRLEDDIDGQKPAVIAFRAPPEAAAFFLEMVARAGSLERLLAHVIVTWVEVGEQFDDYADFTRDEFRCTAPGCTARRNLQSHHLHFRSAVGPDVPWNRTTLCAYHHIRGVHGTGLRISGRAPDGLVFELGPEPVERFLSGDLRCA